MLDAKDTQFRLSEDGVVSFQALDSNPLPGEAIAKLEKGEDVLKPTIVVTDPKDAEANALQDRLKTWWDEHLKTVLEPLAALEDENEFKAPTQEIIKAVHGSLGILPREGLEEVIAKLDADDRKDLRSKRIRLGPILVFIPALNKPAAVRLRALLWSLYNDAALPAQVPNDGIVSCTVDAGAINTAFYQSIGYPVFGPRAIRIDMLDRVICAVYDSAKDGKFQAQHQMAEWLGCGIDDLYAILEAMGHRKIEEKKADEDQGEGTEALEGESDKKPELATFWLKKGKAFEKQKPKSFSASKPKEQKPQKKKGKRNKTDNRQPKIMSAGPKPRLEDSPFAVLEQLKKQ